MLISCDMFRKGGKALPYLLFDYTYSKIAHGMFGFLQSYQVSRCYFSRVLLSFSLSSTKLFSGGGLHHIWTVPAVLMQAKSVVQTCIQATTLQAPHTPCVLCPSVCVCLFAFTYCVSEVHLPTDRLNLYTLCA